jgi:hypothetical protein
MRTVGALVVAVLLAFSASARQQAVGKDSPLPPLDAETLYLLTLEHGASIDMKPGEERFLQLWIQQCCVYSRAIRTAVRYSMDPRPDASIDPYSGVLTISPEARAGTSFRVYADVENGRRIISNDVYVETRQSNPLQGTWRQAGEIACDGLWDRPPHKTMQELRFRNDGTFTATWVPFESYKDYWGFYTFDKPQGRVSLGIRDGNYVPTTFEGDGAFTITEDETRRYLRLTGLSLGRHRSDKEGKDCGAIFVAPK